MRVTVILEREITLKSVCVCVCVCVCMGGDGRGVEIGFHKIKECVEETVVMNLA